jgi:F-type H+-transporting ATPase subunit b
MPPCGVFDKTIPVLQNDAVTRKRGRLMRIMSSLVIVAASALPVLAAEEGVFPPFDARTFSGQLFWLFLSFGLLFILMSKIALPRIGAIIEERRDTIASALAAAEVAQKQAEEASLAHETALASAKANAQAIAQEAKTKSAKEMEATRDAVESALSHKLIGAQARINEMKEKAMGNVDDIAKDAVAAIIQQISGKAPSDAAIAKAIAATRGQ